MKKILIIGGNGFLGKNLIKLLSDYELICPSKQQVNWVTGEGVESLVGLKPDIIIHMLAIYGGLPFCMSNRVKMSLENLEINANVYRYVFNEKPKRIITIGSGCEYPGYVDGILYEDHLGCGKLHKSVEHYGYSKLIQLEICKSLHEELGIEFEHIVLANMYGPHDIFDYERSHVVGGLIRKFMDAKINNTPVQLLGTGIAIRDLIYVKDVAKLIYKLVCLEHSTNQPLNASSGVGTSILELVNLICKHIQFKNEVKWGDKSQDGSLVKVLATDRIRQVLNWVPQTTVEEGIKETINWYESNCNYNNKSSN